jgi:bifunctional UDP-N-acetylglucosamine pyrophosphorylase/glucosamine-1-phosphate N-acetyltransferase
VNDRDQLAMATTLLRQRCVQKHMEGGVSFEDPQCAYIDADIEIGSDTTVGPGVCLYGACTIGSGVTLHAGCVLRDCLVETGAEIFPYSVCDGASIGPRAKVGPFARLRPQTRLDESAKVGNFVEVKKSHLSRGAKASHLAYLGDAHLGERVNIGAGVITCNYDGHLKHPTYIEDDVFVGSNSTLVAPLTLGKGVYVAAGSTLTRNVKANALALGRARQDNKEGYASRFRKTKTKSD